MLTNQNKESTREELKQEWFEKCWYFADLEIRKKETILKLVKVFEDNVVVKYEIKENS